MARVAGSVVSGVRSSALGTSTLPFTLPPAFFWPPSREQVRAAPEGRARTEAVVVLVCGLDAANLEKRSRAENAVLVRLPDVAMKSAAKSGNVQHRRRRVAEFGAEVAALRANVLDDGGGGAQAYVQFLQGVIIHQVELNVFVSTALAGRRIRLTDQVELQPPRVGGRADFLRGRRFGWRWAAPAAARMRSTIQARRPLAALA